MATTRLAIIQNADEICHLMRWWLTQTPKRKRLAMAVGGVSEVIQEAYLKLLSYPPKRHYELSTIAVNQARWTLAKMCAVICEIDIPVPLRDVESGVDVVEECCNMERDAAVWQTVQRLHSRTADIVTRRMKGETLEAIGRIHAITRETVRHIASQGVKKLQHHTLARRLVSFVDPDWRLKHADFETTENDV